MDEDTWELSQTLPTRERKPLAESQRAGTDITSGISLVINDSNRYHHRIRASKSSFLYLPLAQLEKNWIAFKDANFFMGENKDSDQTVRMLSLIRTFVERICEKIRFLTLRLIYRRLVLPVLQQLL